MYYICDLKVPKPSEQFSGYVVKLDIEFAGKRYEDIQFTIDDRKNRTRILLNRDLMVKMNVMVNPQRKYVLTNKVSRDRVRGTKTS